VTHPGDEFRTPDVDHVGGRKYTSLAFLLRNMSSIFVMNHYIVTSVAKKITLGDYRSLVRETQCKPTKSAKDLEAQVARAKKFFLTRPWISV